MKQFAVNSLWWAGAVFALGIFLKSVTLYLSNAIAVWWLPLSAELLVGLAMTLVFTRGLWRFANPSRAESDHRVYGLDHGRLNVELPTQSLWMNMGYWQNTDKFSTACLHLLTQVILKSQIFDAWGTPTRDASRFVSIVDLGFGCGDQSIAVMRSPCKDADGKTTSHKSMFDRYVGITLNRQQFEYAKLRFKHAGLEESESFKVFCADAANPQSWSNDIIDALASLQPESSSRLDTDTKVLKNEIWVLALDCLYHFKPSRMPIFEYSSKTLRANIMAFDLVLHDNISASNLLLLQLIGRLMGCPPRAFLKRYDYLDQLRNVGYDHAEIWDVSEHVFAPLAKFLRRQQKDLEAIGLGLGKLRFAAWIFEWWAKSQVIKGVIVLAKRRD